METFGETEHPVITDTGDFYPKETQSLPDSLRGGEHVECRIDQPERIVVFRGCAMAIASRGNMYCLNVCERAPIGG